MSSWVRTLCTVPVDAASPSWLAEGITSRLALLTYLFCPDEEEEPDAVIERMRIEDVSTPNGDTVWLLHYRNTNDAFIRVERWREESWVREETQELAEGLVGKKGAAVDQILQVLASAKESVALELKAPDLNSMGWPLSIAVAAHFAEAGRGLIQADGYGWMRPDGREVSVLVDE